MTIPEQEIRERLVHKLLEVGVPGPGVVKAADPLFNWIVADDHTQPESIDEKDQANTFYSFLQCPCFHMR